MPLLPCSASFHPYSPADLPAGPNFKRKCSKRRGGLASSLRFALHFQEGTKGTSGGSTPGLGKEIGLSNLKNLSAEIVVISHDAYGQITVPPTGSEALRYRQLEQQMISLKSQSEGSRSALIYNRGDQLPLVPHGAHASCEPVF